MEQHKEENPQEVQDELGELILAYLPPIPNSEGYECRGTVAEKLTEVVDEFIQERLDNAHREFLTATAGGKFEWQIRMPEDRNSEDGWKSNNEQAAIYLECFHGAEVRTRVVTEWKLRGEQ